MARTASLRSSNSEPDSDPISHVLQNTFGYPAFRPGQESVCRAAFEGRDVLVVMPTGSGKSLCFQLPTLALGGTALVISPLIALMEDQVAKLVSFGLRADRIHSGRGRENSRQTAFAFRDGKLQFLFIAPERLAVPGFPEFLARCKPCLVAIDEAHCISQWGHDFRPDYRMLRRYLPLLRPAPFVALTATATPAVQSDICEQLGLEDPLRSIQGFRRKNIAIEVVEVRPRNRPDAVCDLLSDESRRPAIVYTPTRSETESLATELNTRFKTEPYHAGLSAEIRSKVQDQFIRGNIDVMVATVAFGMGIDKPDVRTVVHTAIPGSLEAYYQEIGRAGRDGLPSRAVLMHSYADRHRHDFFFNRDYPEVDVLARIYKLLREQPVDKERLLSISGLHPDAFETALEKLWIHGGALIDPEENVSRGSADWRASYSSHGEQRAGQVELVLRFASAHRCRMADLIHHFGDRTDNQTWCGICDFCAPEECLSQTFRNATADERGTGEQILHCLGGGVSRSTGKLFGDTGAERFMDRDAFEELLGAMARAGLLAMADATFEKDGKQIPYRTVRLTREGQSTTGESLELRLRQSSDQAPGKVRTRSSAPKAHASAQNKVSPAPGDSPNPVVVRDLKQWRLDRARHEKVPAFRILTDRVVNAVASDLPATSGALLGISGISSRCAERYGKDILEIVRRHTQGGRP